MKNRKCPSHKHCWDYRDSNCQNCDIGKCIEGLHKKIDRLKKENQTIKSENEQLKSRIAVLLNPNF